MVHAAAGTLLLSFDPQQTIFIHDKEDADRHTHRFRAEEKISISTEPKTSELQNCSGSFFAKACWSEEEPEWTLQKQQSQTGNGKPMARSDITKNTGGACPGSRGGGSESCSEEEKVFLTPSMSEMRNEEGNAREAIAIVASLKACAKQKDLDTGCKLHADVVQSGLLQKNVIVGNALVNMFAKCGALERAQEVFDQLVLRDVVSWNALISGYSQNGLGAHALRCFQQMQQEGVLPNAITFVCLFKVCGSIGAVEEGKQIHSQIIGDNSLHKDVYIGASLVDMYGKFGLLSEAQEVFDDLDVRNIVSWTSLILGFSQHNKGEQALRYYERMKSEGIQPNEVTFSCILKACSSVGALDKGLQIHSEIVKAGLLEINNVVGNSLVDMYLKLDQLERAQQVFDQLLFRDVVVWNALIGGYAQRNDEKKAFLCFSQMRFEGCAPDATTFACVIKACGNCGALQEGLELHTKIVIHGLVEVDMVVSTALIDMYARFYMLDEAQEVFDELPVQDTVSWTALIAGYTQHGHSEEALKLFDLMQTRGFSPNAITYLCSLKACGGVGSTDRGLDIHRQIVKEGWMEENIAVANALIDMYGKCGLISEATKIFDMINTRDMISWNAMIALYCDDEQFERAMTLVENMQLEGFYPDSVTFSSSLKACGKIGAFTKGHEIHAHIARDGLLEMNLVLSTALVEMYANCGMLAEAEDAFEEQGDRDVVLWNALLAGYAQIGEDKVVSSLFGKMIEDNQIPNIVTHSILLTVYSHQGLVDEGQAQFELLNNSFGPACFIEHYSLMVDLFSRAGRIEEAITLIEGADLSANLAMWFALLGACQKWSEMKLGCWAFECAMQLSKGMPTTYVFMTNVL